MKIAIAQIDTRIGDLKGNAARILAAYEVACRESPDLVVFPELVVTGYPPRDLLHERTFVREAIDATTTLAAKLVGPPAILGSIARASLATPGHPGLLNAALLVRAGRIEATVGKRLLPSYDVFHEHRWFVPGEPSGPVTIAGQRVGILICEDLWDEGYPTHPGRELAAKGAELLVCISASPYRLGVLEKRLAHASEQPVDVVYVNAVGANDELVFDGGSFVVGKSGEVLSALPRFEECVEVVETDSPGTIARELPEAEELFQALVLGVRDFAGKNGLPRAFLGLSGGVDSAVVACIAKEALGPERVSAIAIPSRFSDSRSTETARELSRNLGIAFDVVELEPLHKAAETALAPVLAGEKGSLGAENVQARLRMIVLMAHVNRAGGMLLNTSNKTELALGYGTLYADMAGTLSVIGDLTKPQVYALARWYNARPESRGAIPDFIVDRAPSAELKPDQVDPFDYPRVSDDVEALVQGTPTKGGATPEELTRYRRMIRAAEHKRWQSGIILKVSEKAFGTGRMIPVTRG